MSWRPGDHVLHRFLMHGAAKDVRPVTVVADDPDALVLWLAHGTGIQMARLPGNVDLRAVSKQEMFGQPWESGPHRWTNNALMVLPPDVPYATWLFFTPDGTFTHWYANLQSPYVRWSGGVDIVDHQLDLVVHPDRRIEWKDEDELAAGVAAGWYTPDESDAIYAEAQLLAELAADGKPPFDDEWRDFRPDPAWPIPVLPPTWAAPAP